MTEAGLYRKKAPVQARQLVDDPTLSDPGWEKIAEWCGGRLYNTEIADSGEYETLLVVPTLEGEMTVGEGYWILKGPAGDCWPVRDDVFAATYERVDGDSQ